MRLRDLPFLHDVLPFDQFCDLGVAVVDLELARLDLEEAQENHASASAVVELKMLQYGVGK